VWTVTATYRGKKADSVVAGELVTTMERSEDYARVSAAIAYIGERAPAQPGLDEVAAAAGLSPHHFHRLFRRWAGLTPKRFLQLLTLEEAKRRLDASRSVLEAAYGAGLSGPGRLHDLFVGLEGVTPAEYRRGGDGVEICYGVADSPFGAALVGRTERGVCHLSFLEHAGADLAVAGLQAEWPAARLGRDDGVASAVVAAIFAGDRPPLDVRGTNFQARVWDALLRIPEGGVTCYEDVARALGRPGATRAVAGAVARNRVAWLIPCHRVIRKVGETGGYRWGRDRKQAILAWEAARGV
jgi:AraC family transcriptional regulator, regulatory protein of adaptative response / methylated-DNA-[protein]-cysteine methyltransferase